ncbi:MAG: acyl-CoA dehydrogenase family protein [Chitinophagales bacterium]
MSLKGGAFITGETDYKDVFLPEEWSEEQLMIRDMVRDFCLQEIHSLGIEKAAALDASKDLPFIIELLEKSAELGLCGLSIDKEYGGMDLDFNTGLLFGEAIAIGFSFATTIGAQTSIGSLPIVFYGTPEQKQKYLPGIASAKLKASYCLTEPGAGSDANSGKTKATLSADGKHYLLNGQKMWITNGGFADVFIVFAKIENDKDLSAFIVEKNFGGIQLGKEEKKLGIKGSSTVQVFFNNCPVPVENLLAKRGEGFKIALNILNTGRIKLAAGAIGGSKFAISRAVEYTNQREQFNVPISSFGAMRYKIGEMVMRTFAAESAIYRTGSNIDRKQEEFVKQGMEKSQAKLQAVREFAVECAILKVYGSDVLDYVVDEALQMHGGMGYAVETGIEMGYRDARITRIYEGTNEINRLLSVAELTRRALKTKEVDLIGAGKKLPGIFFNQLLPFKSKSGFDEERRIVRNVKAAFLLISGAAGNKLREKMVDEQEIVMNLADILAEAYIGESLLLRVQKLAEKKDYSAETIAIQKKLLQLFLHESLDKVRKTGYDAIASYSSGFEKGAMNYLLKLLTPEYNVNPKELRRAVADFAIKKNAYPFIG